MTTIAYDANMPWANFHLTTSELGTLADFPQIRVEESGRVHCSDLAALGGIFRFSETRKVLQKHIGHVANRISDQKDAEVNPLTAPYAAGMIGRGWSFSPLIGNKHSQLHLDGLAGCSYPLASDVHPQCQTPVAHIALVSGGTRLAEIVDWAARDGLTILTSGSHLGPTIAGSFGTASHGSKIGYGGVQNCILGIHFVTGENSAVWIERASRPILSDNLFNGTDAAFSDTQLIRDDDKFEDVLIHLGGMGIVNGVAMELTENRLFGLLRKEKLLSKNWMLMAAQGCFQGLAADLGFDAAPAFYEVTIDPHNHPTSKALHTMYFEAPANASGGGVSADLVNASEAILKFVDMLPKGTQWKNVNSSPLWGSQLMGQPGLAAIDPAVSLLVPTAATEESQSPKADKTAFEVYRKLGRFDIPRAPYVGTADEPSHYFWRDLHRGEITSGQPGALYNASFAINCEQVPLAVAAICGATNNLPPTFVFTLRFVTDSRGTLAFTRFPLTAVIEIDGVSPLYWKWQEMAFPDGKPLFDTLANTLSMGALLVRGALATVGVDYSMHWAKLGMLNPEKVEEDYGPSIDLQSPVSRWRRTRRELLGPEGEELFWNDALVQYGLVKRPKFQTS